MQVMQLRQPWWLHRVHTASMISSHLWQSWDRAAFIASSVIVLSLQQSLWKCGICSGLHDSNTVSGASMTVPKLQQPPWNCYSWVVSMIAPPSHQIIWKCCNCWNFTLKATYITILQAWDEISLLSPLLCYFQHVLIFPIKLFLGHPYHCGIPSPSPNPKKQL